jgi:hypothetical protein
MVEQPWSGPDSQADAMTCVVRGRDWGFRERVGRIPVRRSATGRQVFACTPEWSMLAQTEHNSQESA